MDNIINEEVTEVLTNQLEAAGGNCKGMKIAAGVVGVTAILGLIVCGYVAVHNHNARKLREKDEQENPKKAMKFWHFNRKAEDDETDIEEETDEA